ncbi:uncharacterized protein An07g04680 [Aspergillus niger]|uniref:Contig An07c0120, genomic contig n=2 Tax=Aspergillus niger TaxID=5061 RepID=A2QN77_ASPNC|nr:uncharacterized protein An07g04680 [Aspergillus niger]CAK39386.1 unnamed protein product [Aspergillus niger]
MEKENFPLACWAPIPTQVFLGLEERAENGWSGLMKIGAGRIRHSTVAVVSLMGLREPLGRVHRRSGISQRFNPGTTGSELDSHPHESLPGIWPNPPVKLEGS